MESNAAVLRRRSATDSTPVTGINAYELVFVPEMDIFSTGFTFLTIFQVGGLQ